MLRFRVPSTFVEPHGSSTCRSSELCLLQPPSSIDSSTSKPKNELHSIHVFSRSRALKIILCPCSQSPFWNTTTLSLPTVYHAGVVGHTMHIRPRLILLLLHADNTTSVEAGKPADGRSREAAQGGGSSDTGSAPTSSAMDPSVGGPVPVSAMFRQAHSITIVQVVAACAAAYVASGLF